MNGWLSADGFEDLIGLERGKLAPEARFMASGCNFDFEELSEDEASAVAGGVVSHLLVADYVPAGDGRRGNWEGFWNEEAERTQDDLPEITLMPSYLQRKCEPLRLAGRYVRPASPWFERDFLRVLRAHLFSRFVYPLAEAVELEVWELGAGSGHNLVALKKQIPTVRTVSTDWSRSALALAGRHVDNSIALDMLDPNKTGTIPRLPCAFLSVGALEQLGGRWGSILWWMIRSRPSLCLHVEPIEELYDPMDVLDGLAASYHRKRGYLTGFLPALRELERVGRVEVIEVRRVRFGSLYHDGYSTIAWRPL